MVVYHNDSLIIHRLLLNEMKPNCYIVQKGNEAIVVDPSDNAELIIDYLNRNKIKPKYMIATHGHFDHVSGAAGMIESGLVDVLYIHERDFGEVKSAQSYSLMILKRKMKLPSVAMYGLEVTDFLKSWRLAIEHVGGHTKGSSYIYSLDRDFIITGDLALHHKLNITLFDSRENSLEIFRFLKKLKREFAETTVLLPGHGDRSELGVELEKNQKWAYILKKECHGD